MPHSAPGALPAALHCAAVKWSWLRQLIGYDPVNHGQKYPLLALVLGDVIYVGVSWQLPGAAVQLPGALDLDSLGYFFH